MPDIKHITLTDLQNEIKLGIESRLSGNRWISAEISEVKNHSSGHCYLSLVDKSENGSGASAKANAIIWSDNYRLLKPYFETTTGKGLEAGMKIRIKVMVQYSPLYGLSLVVSDIDPDFSVGELEIIRQKTIARLKQDGMFDMNTSLSLPDMIKRIAVISSEGAAGFRDFMNHLFDNEYGFRYTISLYPALMQGSDSPGSVIGALDSIVNDIDNYDVVVILRGGGSAFDLACFDDYDLAANIAQFPLPVLTAIGHDHDYHVADMVANKFLKTPTAVADFLIENMIKEDMRISSLELRLSAALSGKYKDADNQLLIVLQKITHIVEKRWLSEYSRLDILEKEIQNMDPVKLLRSGFTIILKEGRRVTNINSLRKGETIEILAGDNTLSATIESISDSGMFNNNNRC